jgi:hypothetical protein
VDLHELTANGSVPRTQKGEAQFTTTHWSVVLEAQSESPVAQEALEKLCRAYWRPIYSFVQRQGIGLSLMSNTKGQFNTATGAGALLANDGDPTAGEGIENTATGAGALLSNTTGACNSAHGAFALFSNTIGNFNTAIGEKRAL